jgi:hypothetical protein
MVGRVPSHGTDSRTVRGQVQPQDSTAAASCHAVFNRVQHGPTRPSTGADGYPPFSPSTNAFPRPFSAHQVASTSLSPINSPRCHPNCRDTIGDRARSREQVVCPPILQQGAYLIESHFYTHTNQCFFATSGHFRCRGGCPPSWS